MHYKKLYKCKSSMYSKEIAQMKADIESYVVNHRILAVNLPQKEVVHSKLVKYNYKLMMCKSKMDYFNK